MNENYPINMNIGQLGHVIDTRDCVVESWPASEAIPFGRLVCRSNDPAKLGTVRLPYLTTGRIVFDADLITANVINGSVNGEAIDAVTFAASHDNTMDLLVTAIEALDTVKRAELDGSDADNRTILIEVIDANAVLASWAVTLGDTQAGVATSALSNVEQVIGVAIFDHTRENPGNGGAQYAVGDVVGVLRRGHMWVETLDEGDADNAQAMAAKFTANGVFGGASAGKFTMNPGAESADTVALENSRFTAFDVVSGGLNAASIELNFPAALAQA